MLGMGHGRATSVQPGIGDAIVRITGNRYRDLLLSKHGLSGVSPECEPR